jgi:hypothetical protein
MSACIKVKNKVMREHNSTIYLPFGSDFTIFLKNHNSVRASVKIKIDGEDILNGSSLIVNAFSELNLERFLDGGNAKGPKLKFVEKTEAVRETKTETAMDGLVEITYQYEQAYIVSLYPNPLNTLYGSIGDGPIDYNTRTTNLYSSAVGASIGSTSCFDSAVASASSSSLPVAKNDDGMTVKGEDSNQQFINTSIGMLENTVNVITFMLKGDVNQTKVTEPITVKTKIVCKKCNARNAWNANFCSICGNNLKY